MEKCDMCGKETPIMQLGVRYCSKCGESVIRVCRTCDTSPFYCKSCKRKKGKGWHGEHQRHKEVAERAQARGANNKPMVKLETIPKELLPLAKEAMKYKSAEEFADKAIILDGVLSKDFPINKINNLHTKHSIAELKDAKSEILDGTYKHWSREPIRLFYDVGNGSYSIIDGFHRLTRALISGKETIAATLEFSGNKRQLIKFYNTLKRKK